MTRPAAMKQEGFLIQANDDGREKIVRQDRTLVSPKKFFLLADTLKFEVFNVSSFGLAVITTEQELAPLRALFESGVVHNATLFHNDTEIQTIRLKMARVEKHPQSVFNDYVVGFESLGESIAVECVKALEMADEIIQKSRETAAHAATIPEHFKLMVLEMKEFLGQLKTEIDTLEHSAPRDNASQNSDFRQAIAQGISGYLSQTIPPVYQKIPKLLATLDETQLKHCNEFIRNHLGPLVYGAPFADRAYNKPRGYAGDFEMMNHLYRNEVVGKSLFDQVMHKYFIDEPAAQAVKNRGYYLLEQIKKTVRESKKDHIKILAVASGPAMEQQLFLKDCAEFKGRSIEFVCVDQDEESLKHAQRELLSIDRFVKSGYGFRFANLAVRNILNKGLPEKEFDLIYTAGLFDYFTDPVAQMAAKKLYDGLAPDGRLIIGNFSTENPTQPLMEMVLEWHLIYRSVADMDRLFAGIGKHFSVEQEKLGINLFAVIKK